MPPFRDAHHLGVQIGGSQRRPLKLGSRGMEQRQPLQQGFEEELHRAHLETQVDWRH